ncbi:unnamed protein product [Rotaria magnacalcarata]|uniref:G-protein coupled receptors family 1 profile domain-containing protein n=1 Tax=Rotaria magnacalcarata TaxID=392030 RepID=A0A816W3D2_9BILA|nr:unnamed protein product [Rotaria magnacalcarata]CAF4554682.1 unnamed protein product [Rotaria magnacalcarata]
MSFFFPNELWSPQSCLLIIYGQTMVNCLVTYALCVVSLNRLLTIIYGQTSFFRTKRGIALCIAVQWLIAITIPLPTFASDIKHCLLTGLVLDYQIYTLIIIVVLPTFFIIIINAIIFARARQLSRIVQPMCADFSRTVKRRRDTYLLKYMFIMFSIFVSGWAPIYIIAVINWTGSAIPHTIQRIITILPILSLLGDMLNLFIYNQELRKYLFSKI